MASRFIHSVLFVSLSFISTKLARAQIVPLAPGSVSVTPDGTNEPTREANTGGYEVQFSVKNNFSQQVTYTLTCFGRNNVSCGTVDPPQITLGANASDEVFVTYSVGATNPHGRLVLQASGAATDTGYYFVPIVAPTAPIVALRNHNADNRERFRSVLPRAPGKRALGSAVIFSSPMVCLGTRR